MMGAFENQLQENETFESMIELYCNALDTIKQRDKQMEWLQKQGVVQFVDNSYTGKFITNWNSDKLDGSQYLAWAPPDESFYDAINRAIEGQNALAEMTEFWRKIQSERNQK